MDEQRALATNGFVLGDRCRDTRTNEAFQLVLVAIVQLDCELDTFFTTTNLADGLNLLVNVQANIDERLFTTAKIIQEATDLLQLTDQIFQLDQTLTSRDVINTKMRTILDEATDPWGIRVNRVELKNILPPREIQDAMEKQMKAERQRREAILRAEGEKMAAILTAEGEKESAILRADAHKQARILQAEGEAEAILKVQTATAEGIRQINESVPSEAVIKIKALEAFVAAANGQATKIIIPSEIQGLAGLATSVKEIMTDL